MFSHCLIVNIAVDVRLLCVHLEINIKKFALDMNKLLGTKHNWRKKNRKNKTACFIHHVRIIKTTVALRVINYLKLDGYGLLFRYSKEN